LDRIRRRGLDALCIDADARKAAEALRDLKVLQLSFGHIRHPLGTRSDRGDI
jgi:hypothetical protein